jgi:tetratricopeptide (TPR) repeat protein
MNLKNVKTLPALLFLFMISCGHSRPNDYRNRSGIADSIRHVHDSLQNNLTDSLNNLLLRADSLSRKQKHDSALKVCDGVLNYDSTFAEAHLQQGIIHQRRKKFKEAIIACSSAIRLNRLLGRAWFERALCYVQLKQKQEAVSDLNQAMRLHYPGADSLHEKINPLKKRVTGSHCVCCDGTISYSSGSGTCSHHGGVCRKESDYESYREFK